MSTNKVARKKLEKLYGAECFIDKLHLRKEPKRKYKSKGQMQRMKQLTFHHIVMKKDGGKTTVENGALLSSLAHMYIHSLPRNQEEFINNLLREYKRQVDECRLVFVDDFDVPFKVTPVEFYVDERGKYNRAKKKQEDKRLIDKYYEEEER